MCCVQIRTCVHYWEIETPQRENTLEALHAFSIDGLRLRLVWEEGWKIADWKPQGREKNHIYTNSYEILTRSPPPVWGFCLFRIQDLYKLINELVWIDTIFFPNMNSGKGRRRGRCSTRRRKGETGWVVTCGDVKGQNQRVLKLIVTRPLEKCRHT